MAFIIVDNNTGFSLRNLSSVTWNNGSFQNPDRVWTFAGIDRPATKKALEALKAKGFTNVSLVEYNAGKPVKNVITASISSKMEEVTKFDKNPLFDEVQPKCRCCSRNCKQTKLQTIYSCPQFIAG